MHSLEKAHYETHFEKYIVEKLKNQGWFEGHTNEYNTEYALYTQDLIQWIQTTQPQKWDKLQALYGSNTEKRILERLNEELNKKSTIQIFRNGFSIAGAGTIDISESQPEDKRNKAVIDRYNANILRVVPQLKYNPNRNFSIDLVFFINGLPMATAEIKTEFNQSLEHAINQYKQDRKPFDITTKRKEPLLSPKRGAIVHFTVCESEIAMCTALDGENSYFLPFNKGNNGKAGNPPIDTSKNEDYPVAYFWDYVCKPENWLNIFHHFVYIEKKDKVDLYGNWSKQERLIFPRYHQFDAVTKIIADVKSNGIGLNYLCEHSAGSGKTSTISWICHSLIRLRHMDGVPFYNSIIVVTDRTVLDSQLQEAIKQLDHQQGLIANITRDNKEHAGKSKSKQLEEALLAGTPIIIVTIQTFPHVMEAILNHTSLNNRTYAIVIDEAHTSQTGETATKLQATLTSQSTANMMERSIEDILSEMQKSRVQSKNISYFAFTATPKHSTMMLFGRTQNNNLPQSFHIYPQRQAIEEGFILDVLKGYIPYKTAFKLGGEAVNNTRVNSKDAKRALARWMNLHATNVTQKVEFIVQHFHHNVANLLNGQAKAMIVNSSRPAAVRYKIALDKYIEQNPQYQQYRVLVAFSGKLTGKDINQVSDSHTDTGETFKVDDAQEFSESNMNKDLMHADLRQAFDKPQYQLMVVANKFQTGFDQPKLCAMYIDKKIANEVEVVQTLSRLNRTTTGKDQTFIIDFVNDADWILDCFKKYDSGAEIFSVQNPDVVYTLKDNIEELDLITLEDLENFKQVRYKSIYNINSNESNENIHSDLFKSTDKVARIFNDKVKNLVKDFDIIKDYYDKAISENNHQGAEKFEFERKQLDIEIQTMIRFKTNLAKFSRIYSYIAQLLDFSDPDLENFSAFTKLLAKRLAGVPTKQIDISGLVLTGFSIYKDKQNNQDKSNTDDTKDESKPQPLLPIETNSNSDINPSKLVYIKEVIDLITKTFGDTSTKHEQIIYVNHLASILRKDTIVMAQVQNNNEDTALQGNLKSATTDAIIQALNSHTELSSLLLGQDMQVKNNIAKILYKLLKENTLLDAESLR